MLWGGGGGGGRKFPGSRGRKFPKSGGPEGAIFLKQTLQGGEKVSRTGGPGEEISQDVRGSRGRKFPKTEDPGGGSFLGQGLRRSSVHVGQEILFHQSSLPNSDAQGKLGNWEGQSVIYEAYRSG